MKYLVGIVLACLTNLLFAATQAQIISATGPGTSGDIAARAIKDQLEANGIPASIVYKIGAGGAISIDHFYNYKEKNTITILVNGALFLVNYYGSKTVTVDPLKVVPLTNLGYNNPILLARKDLNVHSVKDLNNLNLKVVRIGNAGTGSTTAELSAWIAPHINSHVIHVPYKSISQGLTDLLGGHIDLMVDLGQNINMVKENQVNMIAVMGNHNWTGIKTSRTLKQQNIPEFPVSIFFAAYGHPDNDPGDNQRVRKILTDAHAQGKFTKMYEQLHLTPPESINLDTWWLQQNKDYQNFYNNKLPK